MNNKTTALFLLLAMILTCSVSMAQRENYHARSHARYAGDTMVVNQVGWIGFNFLDEWNIQAQTGGQLYYGFEDRLAPWYSRLTSNYEFYISHHIFPMIGFRAGGGYGSSRGFISKESYNTYLNTLSAEEHNGIGGIHDEGLCGYYHDFNDQLYIQKWKNGFLSGDFFLDYTFFNDLNTYQVLPTWENLLYVGVMLRFAQSEQQGYTNNKPEFHMGYIGKHNIDDRWSVYADLRLSYVQRTYDREWAGYIESETEHGDYVFNFQAGLEYKFNLRSENRRKRFYRLETEQIEQVDAKKAQYVHYVQEEQIEQVLVVDSFLYFVSDSTPSVRIQFIIDSLNDELDDMVGNGHNRNWEQPLDSIFLNRLLPYEMIFFDLDKWNILPSEEMKLAKMAYIMKTYPKEKFILTGSADAKTGTPKRNNFLSHSRADIVYNKLISEYHVDPDQLEREYLGGIEDYKPFQLNRTTVIIMDHPAVRKAFSEMKSKGQAGSGNVEIR